MKVAFLGTGLIAWAHSLALKAMADAGVAAVSIMSGYDRDFARADQFAAVHGCRVAGSPQEALEGAEAVWICTSTAGHAGLLDLAIEAGVPVFCEKPLAPSLEGARAMAHAAGSARLTSQVGLVLRRSPVFVALRNLVSRGEHGRLMAVSFRDDQFFPVQGHYASTWRSQVGEAGGGTVIEHSIHDLDVLAWCLEEGAGAVRAVSAVTGNLAGYEGIEDQAVATLSFEEGPFASLVSVWHQILTRPSTRRVEAIFEKAIIWFDHDFAGSVHVLTERGEQVIEASAPQWVTGLPLPTGDIGLAIRMYAEQDRAFLEMVAAGEPAWPSLTDGVRAHQLVEAVYVSARSGGAPVDPRAL